ncbi:uncharacterized protein LOC109001625 [Juglans regia]|uniref:Uncharacterized protein LOC109001625 n=1 Tax=Juglans regia TaxID=51240 RepID=A0A6P9EMJ1_JUGRE|nr:uncharacterized protein LOC109001625 [Juglans regia]
MVDEADSSGLDPLLCGMRRFLIESSQQEELLSSDRRVIPPDSEFKERILAEAHAAPYSIHPGYLRDEQKHKLAAEAMIDLLERISAFELDDEMDPNMIIGPEMAGDQKRKCPTDGSTSELGYPRDKLKRKLTAKVKNKLLERISAYELDQDGEMVSMAREAPILIATKHGITEMVEKILEISPEAVYEVDSNMKNIVLLSVEHKQPHIYELLLDKKRKNIIHDSVFWEVDKDGNTALHLAATVANSNPWPVSGPAFQMNWEIKWFELVQKSMPESYPFLCNKAGKTPREVFTKSHKELVKEGRQWLINISALACPVATGVFVAVAFSSSPKLDFQINETNSQKQIKLLQYSGLSIANSVSFCLSTISVLCFLRIISSPYDERSFDGGINTVMMAFLFGLASIYLSVSLTVEAFIYGHFLLSDPETASSLHTFFKILMPLFTTVLIIPILMYISLLRPYIRMPHRNSALHLGSFRREIAGWFRGRIAWSRWTK